MKHLHRHHRSASTTASHTEGRTNKALVFLVVPYTVTSNCWEGKMWRATRIVTLVTLVTLSEASVTLGKNIGPYGRVVVESQ